MGIAQIMPATARDLAKTLGLDPYTSPHVAKFAIPAGALYMAQLRSVWKRDRVPLEQHWLAAASYNAGTGSIISAQARCNQAHLWPDISVCLKDVTGEAHAKETLGYVIRIDSNWQKMEQ